MTTSTTPAPFLVSNITVSVENIPKAKQFQEIFIGCLFAIIGNLMISVSLNIQKYTHNKDQKLLELERRHYLKRPLWWIGVILMILGEVGNFVAFGFAPASVVAPLGTSTVIANMFIAVIFLHEQLRPEDLFGSALAIVGAFLIVSFSKRKEHIFNAVQLMQALISVRFIIYISVEMLILAILFFLLYVLKKDNVLILLLITSIIASVTVICAKAVSGLLNLTMAGSIQVRHPLFYIMGAILFATAILQVYYLNMAMKGSDSTVVVPTNFVFFTISAITSGIVFFNEFSGLYSLSIFMFLLGCLLSFIGVYFITFNRAPPAAATADDADSAADVDAASTTEDDAALVKATSGGDGDPAVPDAERGKKRQNVLHEVFPSWLLGTVNPSEVQPKNAEDSATTTVAAVRDSPEDAQAAAAADSADWVVGGAAPSDVDPGAANFLVPSVAGGGGGAAGQSVID